MITISSSSPFLSYPRHVTCRMFPVLKLIDLNPISLTCPAATPPPFLPATSLLSSTPSSVSPDLALSTTTSPNLQSDLDLDRPLRSRPLRLDPSQYDPHPHARTERVHRGPFFLFWYLFFRVTRFHGASSIERRQTRQKRSGEHALYRTIHYKDGRLAASWEGDRGCRGDVGGCAC